MRPSIFAQQRKLMGSFAQICSGVCWCTRRIRFNERGSGRFGRRFRKALVESRARSNEVSEKVLEKVPEGLGAKPSQVQRGFKQVPVRFRECVGAAFRSSSSKFWTAKCVKINCCCCWGYHRSLFCFVLPVVQLKGDISTKWPPPR